MHAGFHVTSTSFFPVASVSTLGLETKQERERERERERESARGMSSAIANEQKHLEEKSAKAARRKDAIEHGTFPPKLGDCQSAHEFILRCHELGVCDICVKVEGRWAVEGDEVYPGLCSCVFPRRGRRIPT